MESTRNYQLAIYNSHLLARKTGGVVFSEHLLHGILSTENSCGQRILNTLNMKAEDILQIFSIDDRQYSTNLSEKTERIVDYAQEIAKDMQVPVATEHLLFAILSDKSCVAYALMNKFEIDPEDLKKNLYDIFRETTKRYEEKAREQEENVKERFDKMMESIEESEQIEIEQQNTKNTFAGREYAPKKLDDCDDSLANSEFEKKIDEEFEKYDENIGNNEVDKSAFTLKFVNTTPSVPTIDNKNIFEKMNSSELEKFGVDLTMMAKENKLDPVIGRGREIERIIQSLCRRTKNSPVLVGEPGVGKSAVVEGLAQAIVAGKVPEALLNKTIYSLDMASLVAGTKYRGEFEERFKNALNIIKKSKKIILFIDEIHTIVNAGSSEGSLDAGNILKPMLARGELQTIGATTLEEYRKHIEKDAALERRFQPVLVEQPTVAETIDILKGLKSRYEKHHKVAIDEKALVAAAIMSDRYITDRFMPDKAIDLVDEASSRKKIFTFTTPEKIRDLNDKIKDIELELGDAIAHEHFLISDKLKFERDKLIEDKEHAELEWKKKCENQKLVVGEEEVAEIVASWTGIPVRKLTETESNKLLNLENTLHSRVIGQNDAVSAVSRAIKRARAGLKDKNKPIGSFIFLGPTGVGKTELSKALAEAMFGDENLMIRFDMSEFMQKENVSKLIGSAPGYVGFDEGGQLTERVRRKPYSVILFDEIEKAHSEVFNIMLQILDDGRLTDSHGRTVSFKNTIIIMTSNAGATDIETSHKLGFVSGDNQSDYENQKETQKNALKKIMKPEFLNRLDDIVVFKKLDKAEAGKIGELMLVGLKNRLKDQGITILISKQAEELIVEKGYSSEYGARPLRRTIQRLVEDTLSEKILAGDFKVGDAIKVDTDDEEKNIVFKK